MTFFENVSVGIGWIGDIRACDIGQGGLRRDAINGLNVEVLNCGRATGYDIISRGLSELAEG